VAAGRPVVLQEHGGVLVELDVRGVGAARLLLAADDDGLDHIALLHVAAGDRVLHGRDHHVTQTRVTAGGATEHADGEQLLRAGVVGDLQAGFVLNHLLLRLLEDLDQAPPLGGGQGTGLTDDDEVADAGGVALVVHLALLGAAHDLAVQGVLHAVLDLDDDGLVHLVADDVAALRLAVSTGRRVAHVVLGGLVSGVLGGLSHHSASSFASAGSVRRPASSAASALVSAASAFLALFFAFVVSTGAGVARMPSSRSRITVYSRAMSRLTARMRPWLSSWPVADWKRRLNSSSLALRNSSTRRWSSNVSSSLGASVLVPTAITRRPPRA